MAIYIVAWFAIVLPLIGAGASFFADSARRAGQICRAFAVLSLLLTLVVLATRLKTASQGPFDSFITFFAMTPPETLTFASRFEPQLGVHVDSITAVFAALMAFIAVAVQSYAAVALRGDAGYRRFFWAASLLLFAVVALAYSPNLFQFWLMSAIASLATYILMLHWWDQPDAGLRARRVYVTLCIADTALLLALVFAFIKFGLFAVQQPPQIGSDIFDPFSFSGLRTIVTAAQHAGIAGVGLRTLEVTGVLLLFVSFVRSAQIPFHVWFTEAVHAPVAVIALVTSTAGVTGAYLLAREYPLLISAPHVPAAVALVGAATAALCGALAVAQRDLYRAGALISASMLGLSFAALGAGGFGAGLFALAVAALLSALFFMTAGNVVRAYRSRDLDELGGAWRRMRVTSLGLGAWALGAGGLSLSLYYALSVVFDNTLPNGSRLGGLARALCIALLIVGGIAVSAAALSVVLKVCAGDPARRRGFQPEKVADTRDPALRWSVIVLIAALALVLFALPSVAPANLGRAGVVGLNWMDLVVFGPSVPSSHVAFNALGLSLLTLVLGAVVAALLNPLSGRSGAHASLPAPAWLSAATRDLHVERVVQHLGRPFLVAGALIARFDTRVAETLSESIAEGVTLAGEGASRVRRLRSNAYLAGAAAFVALLAVLSMLAATGHLGGVTL